MGMGILTQVLEIRQTNCGSLFMKKTMKQHRSGLKRLVFLQNVSFVSAKRITSGNMVPVLAVLVLKSTSIAAKALAAADRNVRLAAIATASWRSGTWYSPSLILTATATMNACQNQTSIPVWVWNVWLALCRMSATCSR